MRLTGTRFHLPFELSIILFFDMLLQYRADSVDKQPLSASYPSKNYKSVLYLHGRKLISIKLSTCPRTDFLTLLKHYNHKIEMIKKISILNTDKNSK